MYKGYRGRILQIDLSKEREVEIELDEEIYEKFLGGKGIAIYLLYKNLKKNVSPLSKSNILIFMTGPLTGTGAPFCGRFIAMSKSPLTNTIFTSTCGGPFGVYLKRANYDGLIVSGKARSPMYLEIKDGVEFRDADNLWGKSTEKTIDALGKNSVVIGPAGENLVKFACIRSANRFLGRGGLGAVMGSKNLKAVTVSGNKKVEIYDRKKFREFVERVGKIVKKDEITGYSLKRYGTNMLVNLINERRMIPVKNFQHGYFDDADKIGGEAQEKRYEGRDGCTQCSVRCGHVIGGKKAPEYETTSLLGTNLGISDLGEIIEWNRICDDLGMDTISVGGILGFLMELSEKGILDSNLRFGNTKNISKTIREIALKKDFGREIAKGVKYLAENYDGKKYAMHVKGLEMGAYDPRRAFGMGLNYATCNMGARHNDAYPISTEVQGVPVFINPYSSKKAVHIKWGQDFFSALRSSIFCIFSAWALGHLSKTINFLPSKFLSFFTLNFPRFAYKFYRIDIYPELLNSVIGMRLSQNSFLKIGERVFNFERMFNVREGFSSREDTLPQRFFTPLDGDE
ncbi:MAG: aldehyde ferredoxin oxidoreductase family protein, partial [Candidatus Methanofastidiosia archaeon]